MTDADARLPTVRPSNPVTTPGGDWRFLDPQRHPFGFWTVRCPNGCGARVEIWEVDGVAWVLAPEPRCCPVDVLALRLASLTGRPAAEFMPYWPLSEGLVDGHTGLGDDLARLVASDVRVGAAFQGTVRFTSPASRRAALGYRLAEAGADAGVLALALCCLPEGVA